jgi:hypothetical protein
MPHDRKNNLLKEGDIVMIPCIVRSLSNGEDLCNCTVETIEKFYPSEQIHTFTLNTRQVEKVE